jgi:hypothetical protein
MGEFIYSVYEYLSDVPVNFWYWLFWITAPLLVFSAKPESTYWRRIGRLLLAIALTYVFLNLSIGAEHSLAWDAYRACEEQSQHRDMSPEMHKECKPHLDALNDTNALFAFAFGYFLTAAYTGFWELLWRIRYRKAVRAYGKGYEGKWTSNILIALAIPPTLIISILVVWGLCLRLL